MTETAAVRPALSVTAVADAEPMVVNPLARLAPLLWVLGILVFEIGTWMGDRLRFPGDTAIQIVLILAFVAYGVRLRERQEIHGARLALILAGLLAGFSIDRWLLGPLALLAGGSPAILDEYSIRTLREVLSVFLHTAPAIALLLWTHMGHKEFRLSFGDLRRLTFDTRGRLIAAGLVLVLAGVLAWRLPAAGQLLPIVQSAGITGLVLAIVYALANAVGAEIIYRAVLISVLRPVMGTIQANVVQSAAYALGFGLYGVVSFGLVGLLFAAGAGMVSIIFGAASLRTGGIGVLVLLHALATFLFELSGVPLQ